MILRLKLLQHYLNAGIVGTVPRQKSSRKLINSRKFAFLREKPPTIVTIITMNRTPLQTIDGNIPRRKELTPYHRGIIVGQGSLGSGATSIGRSLNHPESTIRSVLSASTHQHQGVSKPRSGRPTVVTDRARRIIIRNARIHPKITYKVLRALANIIFSKSTMYRVLKDAGITNWLAKKRPKLRPQDVAARLAWAKKYKDWTYDDWAKIIWSDECSVGSGYRRESVFRTPSQK